jgi:hypothetical protein
MALGDRPIVEGLGLENAKDLVGARARVREALVQLMA